MSGGRQRQILGHATEVSATSRPTTFSTTAVAIKLCSHSLLWPRYFFDVVSLSMVPLGLTTSISLTTTHPLCPLCVSDHRICEKCRWIRLLERWTETWLVVSSRILLQPKETKSTRVMNTLASLFISFGLYSSFNPHRSRLSHVTLGYSESGTRSWFQKIFSSGMNSSGKELIAHWST